MRSKRAGGKRVAQACFIAVLGACGLAKADQQTVTWLGGNGTWSTASKWSGGVVPNNNDSTSFQVQFDGGNPVASNGTLNAAVTIDSLQLDSGDSLTVSSTLSVVGSATINGTLSPLGRVALGASPTIEGSGTILLGNFINVGTLDASSGALTLGSQLTIRTNGGDAVYLTPGGYVGTASLPTVNRAHFLADSGGRVLVIAGNGITNRGVLEVKNSATLGMAGSFSLASLAR